MLGRRFFRKKFTATVTNQHILRHNSESQSGEMNSQCFKEQILPVYAQMIAVAARMFDGDITSAADAVQDTIANLWERRREIEISRSPQALCISAVRNRCISIIRSQRNFSFADSDTVNVADSASADSNTDIQRIHMAVNLLPEPQRTVIKMSMRGFSSEEIAAENHISQSNVRQILSRGRRSLRSLLEQL